MITTLILTAVVGLIFMGVMAPYETLGWWGGWYGDKPDETALATNEKNTPISDANQFVVYLTGVGGTSPTEYSELEQNLLTKLKEQLPDVELVADVFPYSSGNRALTGERFFSWFWRALKHIKGRSKLGVIAFLINIRNIWQVLVSSDSRFGPLYNYASAQMVLERLLKHGYKVGSGIPITLIGYSGGGQISTGAAPLLKEAIKAPVHIISLGGVISSNENILKLNSLTYLYGSKDNTERFGYFFFPSRWPFLPWTAWNRARKGNLIQHVLLGPMEHTGTNGYLDDAAKLKNGQSYLAITVATITDIVSKQLNS